MQLVLQIGPKASDDPYLDCQILKRGDVIDIFEDDFDLSAFPGIVEQIKLGQWVIVSVPWKREECDAMLAPEPGDPKTNKMLQRRAFKLDVDALPDATAKAAIENASKAETVSVIAIADQDAKAVKVQRPALEDPAIIGPTDEAVIG